MSKLLINEPPLMVLPSLAKAIGLNEAIFVQQVYFWMHNAKAAPKLPIWAQTDERGRVWIRGGFDEWGKRNFPFWHPDTIRKIAARCEETGVLLSEKRNENRFDQTNWYTVDNGRLVLIEPDDSSSSEPDDSSSSYIEDIEDVEEYPKAKENSRANAPFANAKAPAAQDTALPSSLFDVQEKEDTTNKAIAKSRKVKTNNPPAARPPTPQQELFQAVCDAVGWDAKTCNAGQVSQMVGKLKKGGYTPADVRTWRADVWPEGWQYRKDGRNPTVTELGNGIAEVKHTAFVQQVPATDWNAIFASL